MRIEIWSDVACPWCYIGKRRLEQALEGFEHRDEVEVLWRSFLLDPGAPAQPTSETTAEHLGRKYGGGPAAGQQMVDRMEATAAEAGLLFRLGAAQRVSTIDAHRVLHLAGDPDHGGSAERLDALKERLLRAYMVESANVADPAVLTEAATEVGIDAERVAEVLAGKEYADDVEADIDQAAAFGATGVPFFVIDRKYGVAGAQPAEAFTQVLERAWADAHPVLQMAGGDDAGDACGPDGCAI
jgi:predicted DsbA family dithiol-disulfide isomerase